VNTEESRKTVMGFLAAQAQGDAEAIRRLTADDLRWEPPASVMPPVEGREAVLAAMAKAGEEFFDLGTMEADVHKVVAEGDTVVIVQSMKCKTAKGADYANQYCWVYTCADGRVKRMQEFVDSKRFDEIMNG
jgi:ketosteroid isomerase-like protein